MLWYLATAVTAVVLWRVLWKLDFVRRQLIVMKKIKMHGDFDSYFSFAFFRKVKDIDSFFRAVEPWVFRHCVKHYALWVMGIPYPCYFFVKPAGVKAVMQLPASEPKGPIYNHLVPWLGDGLLISSGKKWERNRRLLTQAFHFDILRPYVAVYNRVVDRFLDNISAVTTGGDSVDIYPLVSAATLDTMLRCALSYEDDIQDLNGGIPSLHDSDILLGSKDENGEGLSDLEIRQEVDTFMFEGHDTTASAITWALHSLAKYPGEQEKVLEEVNRVLGDKAEPDWTDLSELKYVTCFLKESLRLHATVPAGTRTLTKTTNIEGANIPAGTELQFQIALMNRHPDLWADPEEFRPSRFMYENRRGVDPFTFVPFSAGTRNCIGQNFAMNEMKVFMARIVRRFKLALDPTRDAVPFVSLVLKSLNGIYLYVQERNTSRDSLDQCQGSGCALDDG